MTFTNRFATRQQQIMMRADEPKRTNPFTSILSDLTPEQVDEINECLNTHYQTNNHRFKSIAKIIFGEIADSITDLRTKVINMEDLMTHTVEYCFTKEFANAKGDNNMETARKTIKDINDTMKRAEGAAEERSRLGTEASGSAGMHLG